MAKFNKIIIVVAAALLSGCTEKKEEISDYIAGVQAKQKPAIEPMPVMKSYEKFEYSAKDLRNPFIETVIDVLPVEEDLTAKIDNGIQPDRNRLKEILESYPLTELHLVGTLQQENIWALIRAPEGVIHRVKVGDYIGTNDGKILTISDTEVSLKEIVKDGDGGYVEREASLLVADVN